MIFLVTGCSEMGKLMDGYMEADRSVRNHQSLRGGASSVEDRSFVYTLYLADGSSICRTHDGSFDPRTLVGGYVGNKRIVRVEDGIGSCN